MNPATLKATSKRNAKRIADARKKEQEVVRRRETAALKKYQNLMRPAVIATAEAAIMAAVDRGDTSAEVTFADPSDSSGYLTLAWELDEVFSAQGFQVYVSDIEYGDTNPIYVVNVEISWDGTTA